MDTHTAKKRMLIGIVISDAMQKTRVIEVPFVTMHPTYLKRYTVHRRFKAHDEKNEYKTGDRVMIEETRPLSKEKRWIIVEKLEDRK